MEKQPETIKFKNVDISNPSVLKQPPNRFRRCPIMVTLADSQITIVEIQTLLESGMNIAKFRMGQSKKGEKLRLLGKIDKATLACCSKYGIRNWPISTCIELKTCTVNTGTTANEERRLSLTERSEVFVSYDIPKLNKCDKNRIYVDDPYFIPDLNEGADIYIDGDKVMLKYVTKIDNHTIKCFVTKGGDVLDFSRVCASQTKRSRPLLTKEDYQNVIFALEYQIDNILINYVRHADTVRDIKKFIKSKNIKSPFILSGICTEQCLENIDEIIKESHGIILSREYLPYETKASYMFRLAHIQKWLSGKCLQAGKPFYISGGVFDETLKSGDFLNCEISDVTNALFDDVNGFILKECSDAAVTVDVLKGLNELCYTIEPLLTSKTKFNRIIDELKMPVNAAQASVIACATLANQTAANVIIVPTISGTTIKYLHWMRPCCIIITVSPDIRTTRLLRTYRSVVPLLFMEQRQSHWNKTVEARISFAVDYAVNKNWLLYGDTYVTLERASESSSYCDTIRVWKVTISKKALIECDDGEQLLYVSEACLY